MYRYFTRLLLPSLFLSLLSAQAAATIVRLDIEIGSQAPQAVYIELLDQDAPATVANFLNYVENSVGERRYDNTFAHRLATNFVVQLGGYVFDPTLGSFEGSGVFHIPVDAPVVNEFSVDRSNLRGTIAMAKLGGDPDSATSEWFFNLKDNSSNLDTQNGGFTVFGRILGTGMDTVDAIAGLNTQNASSSTPALTAVPVADYTPGDAIVLANLVKLNQVLKDPPAAIFVDNINPDFGDVETGFGPGSRVITIQNIGSNDLNIGTIGDIDNLSAPFSISVDNCSGKSLVSLQTCTITAEYAPTALGADQDSFNVPSNDINLSELTITLSGTGVTPTAPVLDVTPSGIIELPVVLVGDTASRDIVVKNSGGGLLLPGATSIIGADTNVYSVAQDNCVGISLALGETCTITVEIFGDSEGNKTATFQIDAEPGSQSFQATLSGSVVPPAPDIDVNELISVPDTVVGETLEGGFGIRNIGLDPLTVTNIEIIGADASLFTLGSTCVREVQPGAGCRESIVFSPVIATDSVNATIRINSNDPDSPVVEIPVNASASSDKDGITDAIENQAPNGGDGNNDGIADAMQAHVASLPNINGDYITIEAAANQTLVGISSLENPSPANAPVINSQGSLDFNQGFFGFTIEDVPASGSATVTIYLTGNSTANTYFKYGITPDNPFFDHWYQFNFDGETGAEFLGDRIVLHFVDGGRGDSDLTVNGRIVDPGGPATITVSSSGSSSGGGGGGCSLAINENQRQKSSLSIDFFVLIMGLFFIYFRNRCSIF